VRFADRSTSRLNQGAISRHEPPKLIQWVAGRGFFGVSSKAIRLNPLKYLLQVFWQKRQRSSVTQLALAITARPSPR
jgi:hypothetical protein